MNRSVIILLAVAFVANVGSTADESDPVSRWLTLCAGQAAAAEQAGRMVVPGRDGWLFLAAELHHVGAGRFWGDEAARVSRAAQADQADPLPAILDFKRQLDELGIELLLVPVPPKAALYPDKLESSPFAGPPAPRLDTTDREFYDLLESEGVAVLDLTPAFLSARSSEAAPLYCLQDSHWSGRACVLAAGEIARALKDQSWRTVVARRDYETIDEEVEISGDLWMALDEPRPAREKVRIRRVLSGGAPVPPERSSPALLLGDSHNLVFHAGGDMQTTGAGLADQLAFELGFPMDVLGVRGSGATPARISLYRRSRAQADYFAGKQIIIWCFGAREFTESSGWSKVPVR